MSEERITEGELELIKQSRAKQETANLQAEKFVALLKIANLEFDNLVMNVYNKYGLRVGKDTILESGVINRAPGVPQPMEAAPPAEVHSERVGTPEKVEGDVNG